MDGTETDRMPCYSVSDTLIELPVVLISSTIKGGSEMVELVQATPEELDAFSKKCTARGQESATLVSKAISEVEGVRAKWGGDFAIAFGAQWAMWQKDMKEFPKEVDKTAAEMTRLAAIYRQADEEARAATAAIPDPGEGGSMGSGGGVF